MRSMNPATRTSEAHSAAPPRRQRPRIYKSVLSLAVAALVAAWLPFSALYITALNHPTPATRTIRTVHGNGGTTRIVTSASGRTSVIPPSAGSSPALPAAATIPVSTHSS